MPNEIIAKFSGEYFFLSNFYPGGNNTTEHYYQALKFKQEKLQNLVLAQPTPGDAKKMSRKLSHYVREDWFDLSLVAMEICLRSKFESGALREKLIATYPAYLVEGNHWHDNFYGDCTCRKCKPIEGENHLGKLLMKLREEYRGEQVRKTAKTD